MRKFALAAAMGAALAAGPAFAEQWTDPAGRVTFNAPSGWSVQPQNASGQTVVLAFNPSSDCYVFGVSNPATANSSPDAARNTTDPLTTEAWTNAANTLADFFPGRSAQLVSQTVDTSGFWPVQRAQLQGGSRTVFGVIQVRPGFELRAFCSGASSASAYDAIFSSLAHPNDAAWQSQAQQQVADRDARAAEAAAAAAAQEEEQQQQQQDADESESNREPTRSSRDPRSRRRD